MRKITFFALLLLLLSAVSSRAWAAPKEATFEGTPEEVFNAAVLAAQKNWTVTATDRPTMTLSFTTGTSLRTWGMDCSVVLTPVDGGKVKVIVRTQKKAQLYAWNVGNSIADKFFAGLEQELTKARSAGQPSKSPQLKKPVGE
jgi:hypothetical protein